MRWFNCVRWMIVLAGLSNRLMIVKGEESLIGSYEACIDFVAGDNSTSAWSLDECVEVWSQFVDTIPRHQWKRHRYADDWKETTAELRLAGSPCLCQSYGAHDGVGGMTMRMLASWIFAEEMGCDWVTPDWLIPLIDGGNGTVLYCHKTNIYRKRGNPSLSMSALEEENHCSVVDWLSYFQFNVPSVSLPKGAKLKTIEVGHDTENNSELARWSQNDENSADQGWDRILFKYKKSRATESLTAVANWDADRRQTVRTVVAQARHNFHVQPRPWYSENMKCGYDTARLNFAIHVRLGDRSAMLGETEQYFLLLEQFMNTVSEEVIRKGLKPPLFHVFSETLLPCPSNATGIFDEFPSWPVHQVPECLKEETLDRCHKTRAGRPCSPVRSGTFDVIGLPVVLHLDPDAHNALSCMIQADGLLMGCSTFGQLAGILSNGISFFSMHCEGKLTFNHYKSIPPIAVAERGHLWVPVTGSWRDPAIYSTDLLIGALDTFLEHKGVPSP